MRQKMKKRYSTLPWKSILGILLSVILLIGNPLEAKIINVENVKVISVVDGDTAHMELPGYGRQTIRTWGIDCPEKKQKFGNAATEFYTSLIQGKEVFLKVRSKDIYGRLIAQVFVDNVDIGLYMVQNGYAWHYVSITKNKELAKAQAHAEEQKLGLWRDAQPTAPWVYRKLPKWQ